MPVSSQCIMGNSRLLSRIDIQNSLGRLYIELEVETGNKSVKY